MPRKFSGRLTDGNLVFIRYCDHFRGRFESLYGFSNPFGLFLFLTKLAVIMDSLPSLPLPLGKNELPVLSTLLGLVT